MEKLKDKETGLVWYKSNRSNESAEIISELDSWKSASIKTYISCKQNLGEFLQVRKAIAPNTRNQFFAYDGGDLVATALTSSALHLSKQTTFEELCEYYKFKVRENETDLPIETVKKIFEGNNNHNNDEILYLVVNPIYHNFGYGTNSVNTIVKNLDFFAPNSEHNSISTSIHKENFASQKVFERNGFKRLDEQLTDGQFYEYYLDN